MLWTFTEPVKPENETQQNDDKRTEEPHEPHEIHHQQQTKEDEQKPKEESDTWIRLMR